MSKQNKIKAEYLQNLTGWNSFIEQAAENIVFSFKYYQYGNSGGQCFEEWQEDNILADLNNKLQAFSGKKVKELLVDRTLEMYNSYPKDSKFKKPEALTFPEVKWARLRLTGARRLIGFFLDLTVREEDDNRKLKMRNTFYIVFLDKKHEFAPYVKK